MIFSFDTNIFIDLNRTNPMEREQNVWDLLGNLLDNGTIIVSKEVYEELKLKSDDLAPFLRNYTHAIIESDKKIQKIIYKFLKKYPNWIDPNFTEPFADPFVIALALSRNGSVVTNEVMNDDHFNNPQQMLNQSHALKIPNVCHVNSIPCTNYIGFLTDVGNFDF